MKKCTKKVLALLLGTVIAVSLFAGCGKKTEVTSTTVENAASQTGTSEVDKAETTAPVIDTSEFVELKMYLVGDKPEGFDDVYAKINEILKEKLNCTISVDWLSWGDHGTKYSLLFSSGEDFDMIFTASSWCHYEQTVALGGFKALDEEFIKTFAPDLWATEPELAWEQAKIGNNIYMVPANYIEVTPDTFAVRGDWMKAFGYEDLTSYDELIDFFMDLAADGKYGTTRSLGTYWAWFEMDGKQVVQGTPKNGQMVLYNGLDTTDNSVNYVLDMEGFAEYCKQAKEMATAGCWPSDVLSAVEDRQAGLLSGRAATLQWNAGTNRIYANQANAEHPEWDVNIYNLNPNIKYASTRYINGGIGINATSKNPERAMMVINEFATNKAIQDLAQLGIEGVNWEAVDDEHYKVIAEKPYIASNIWGWRNMDLMRKETSDNPTSVDVRLQELNAYFLSNIKDVHTLDSFKFDSTNVSTQFAAVEAVATTYFDPLVTGLVDDVDASIEEFRKAMDDAGMQDVLNELQKQVDEYISSK